VAPVPFSAHGVPEHGRLDYNRTWDRRPDAWAVPSIDLGMGTLIGVVALGGCFLWLSCISTLEGAIRP
jgi:hypothetical protein